MPRNTSRRSAASTFCYRNLFLLLLPLSALGVEYSNGVCSAITGDSLDVEWACADVTVTPPPESPPPSTPGEWSVLNPVDPARLEVNWQDGAYTGHLKQDPGTQQALWYNAQEGRMDYVRLSGDFTVTLRGVSLEVIGNYQWEYQFAGLIVRESAGNYEFAVIGNRGGTLNTIEYKVTRNSSSQQGDIGNNAISGKTDLRVIRNGSQLDFFHLSGSNWVKLPHDSLSANRLNTSADIDVGIITYGYSWPDEFIATVDSVEFN